jgi:S1-C subfamily serine protease
MWALRGGINRLRFHCILAALSGISILKSERQIKPYYRFITFCDSYNDFNDEDEKDEKESRKGLSTKVSTSWLARNFVAEAADIVSPSVVNILCETKGNFVKRVSSGSGFIYSKDGYIVTNEHVVAQSSDGRVLVTMWNSMKRQGIVHSVDKQSDIAIVKLLDVRYDEDLPVATMGSSGEYSPSILSQSFMLRS